MKVNKRWSRGERGCDRKQGEQKERRGRMEGREAHSELWSGYWKRETYTHTHFYKVFKGVQIIWNTHRKHTAIMLCALRFQGASIVHILILHYTNNLNYGRQSKCSTIPYLSYFFLLLVTIAFWPSCQKIHIEIDISFSSEFFSPGHIQFIAAMAYFLLHHTTILTILKTECIH